LTAFAILGLTPACADGGNLPHGSGVLGGMNGPSVSPSLQRWMRRRPSSAPTASSGSRARVLPSLSALAFLPLLPALVLLPTSGSAQEVRGLVAEQGSLDPVPRAVVTLFRVPDGTDDLIPAGTTVSGDDGGFTLRADAPGRYRVQATHLDLSSPLSAEFRLEGSGGVDDVALLIPSRLLMMGYGCPDEELEGGRSVVVGVVRDGLSEIPLSGARVTVRWMDREGDGELTAETDATGHYRLCGVPSGGFVRIQGAFLGQEGEWTEVEVARPAMVLHDVAVTAGLAPARVQPPGQGPIQERILMEATAHSLGDLRGELLDAGSGQPIAQASVRLGEGRQLRITDESGRFAFQGVQPGRYLLEIAHLGYAVQSDEVEVPGGRDVFVRLRVSPQAVELDGIEVEVRGAVVELQRITPFRRDIVYGQAMADAERRGATVVDVLRTSSPGLRVQTLYLASGQPVLCIRSNRAVATLGSGGASCPSPEVVLDGTRISDGAEVLLRLPSSEVESVEFLPASQAQTLYGIGGNTANGAVVVWSRGRGPYASPLRNP
jgi:hypothetical protein